MTNVIIQSAPSIQLLYNTEGQETDLLILDGGIPGPAGSSSTTGSSIIRVAGETLGGHRAVRSLSDGTIRLADKDTSYSVIGLTVGAAGIGDLVTVQLAGELIELGWNWVPGSIWLGNNGLLTQTVPTTGGLVEVGIAASATSMLINPRTVARLT